MADASWIAKLRQGDQRAFERLLEQYREPIFRLAYRIVGPADADDAAQEAFIKIYRGLPTFRGGSQLNTWLYRVALNACYEYRRRRKVVELPLLAPVEVDKDDDPEKTAMENLLWARIEEALDKMDEKHREALILHELQGLTYGEAAKVIGVPVGTVKSRLHYAFQELRRILQEMGVEA
ncbi:MAG: RNA polymerase sigma factor [Armatimonadetes bacterium]|nr:RNA polymerase sigma factor [Armatimonadota bacterium]